jgi:hypothetical protein
MRCDDDRKQEKTKNKKRSPSKIQGIGADLVSMSESS